MTRDEYFEGLLFPLVPVEDWAATHDFQLDPIPCPQCGNSLAPDRPFASKTMRGFFMLSVNAVRCQRSCSGPLTPLSGPLIGSSLLGCMST